MNISEKRKRRLLVDDYLDEESLTIEEKLVMCKLTFMYDGKNRDSFASKGGAFDKTYRRLCKIKPFTYNKLCWNYDIDPKLINDEEVLIGLIVRLLKLYKYRIVSSALRLYHLLRLDKEKLINKINSEIPETDMIDILVMYLTDNKIWIHHYIHLITMELERRWEFGPNFRKDVYGWDDNDYEKTLKFTDF